MGQEFSVEDRQFINQELMKILHGRMLREQEERSRQEREQIEAEHQRIIQQQRREYQQQIERKRQQQQRLRQQEEERARRDREARQAQQQRNIQNQQRIYREQLEQQKRDLIQKKEQEKRLQEEQRRKLREEYPCPQFLKEHVIKVNICVTGPSGSGKSTLTNILRGLRPGQEGVARVGVNECTKCPTVYQFPNNHKFYNKVQLWDLPGAGTELFPQETYVQHMGIRWFDACIVVGDTRVREEEVALIKEMERTLVPYLYVRTKMDQQVEDNMHENGYDADQTFKMVKDSLIQVSGIKRPYLIGRDFVRGGDVDSWENGDYKILMEDLNAIIDKSVTKKMTA